MTPIQRSILILCIPWMFGGGVRAAAAQCDWRFEIDRAMSMIERTRDPVARSGIPEARELLEAARIRVQEAEDRGRRGEVEFACRLARVSQSLATKAGEIAIRGLRGLEELERMLQRSDELIQEGIARLRTEEDPGSRAILQSARDQQMEAWSAFRSRRPRLALKLTLMARESVRRAYRQGRSGDGLDAAQVLLEIEQTDRVLAEARRIVDEDARGFEPALLGNAERLQTQARRRLDRARPALALALTREARALIGRALGETDLDPEPLEVTSLLETTAELIERLSTDAIDLRNDRATELLGRARALLDQGSRAHAEGRWLDALAAARGASALALDAADILEPGREE